MQTYPALSVCQSRGEACIAHPPLCGHLSNGCSCLRVAGWLQFPLDNDGLGKLPGMMCPTLLKRDYVLSCWHGDLHAVGRDFDSWPSNP